MSANQSMGLLKKSKNSWYDNCRSFIEKRRRAKNKYIRLGTTDSQELFIIDRKNCKKV